uniref:Uncharacterized protein n=1 Tax=Photinus pyralis TaxID=7054 RepID=A0A1Y1K3D1_PHOPY
MSRITRSTLPITEEMLKPAVIENVKSKLQVLRGVQAKYANQNKKEETTPLKTGDAVRIETSHRNWIAGKVIAETQNPRSVVVKTNDGKVIRRNSTHLHKTIAEIPTLPKAPYLHRVRKKILVPPKRHQRTKERNHHQLTLIRRKLLEPDELSKHHRDLTYKCY